jgi:hypothetical protein
MPDRPDFGCILRVTAGQESARRVSPPRCSGSCDRRGCRSRPSWIAELIQTALELGSLCDGNLNPGQNPAVISAVIAVVEQRDIPAAGEPVQELEERSRPLRELEAEDQIVLKTGCPAM